MSIVLALAAAPAAHAAIPPWQSYVEAPRSADITPARVIQISGEVTNPQALAGGGGATTLTYPAGGTAPRLVLDYGREVGGRPHYTVTAASGLPVMKSAFSERLANLGASGDVAITADVVQSGDLARFDEYPIAGPETISDPDIQGGERYESITLATPGRVTLSAAGIRFSGVMGGPTALRGWFRSSDDLLNRIFYAGVYTLNLNQLQPGTAGDLPGEVDNADLMIDGAKRDRLVWSGDLLADGPSVFDTLDPAYIRDSLALVGSHPASGAGLLEPAIGLMASPGPLGGVCAPYTTISACLAWSANYSMVFVPALYEYYLYTGDAAFVRQEWPAVTRELAWDAQQVGADGLFATNLADGFDWNVEDPAGELTYDNALYVMALRDGALLAPAAGDGGAAAGYSARADAVSAAVNARLWNPALNAYGASSAQRGALVQDGNVLAALSGVASSVRASAALQTVASRLATPYGVRATQLPAPSGYIATISPYMGGFELLADFQAGLTTDALAQMRTEWGWMVDHDPGGVDWEKIEPNGTLTPLDSAAHGWSTGATGALTQYVLGVVPSSAGFATFNVTPHPGNLAWAQGSVPTPHGAIAVSWRHRGSTFALSVRFPSGTHPHVIPPPGAAMRCRTAATSLVCTSMKGNR